MLSTPGDFPGFRLCTACSTSSLSTGTEIVLQVSGVGSDSPILCAILCKHALQMKVQRHYLEREGERDRNKTQGDSVMDNG